MELPGEDGGPGAVHPNHIPGGGKSAAALKEQRSQVLRARGETQEPGDREDPAGEHGGLNGFTELLGLGGLEPGEEFGEPWLDGEGGRGRAPDHRLLRRRPAGEGKGDTGESLPDRKEDPVLPIHNMPNGVPDSPESEARNAVRGSDYPGREYCIPGREYESLGMGTCSAGRGSFNSGKGFKSPRSEYNSPGRGICNPEKGSECPGRESDFSLLNSSNPGMEYRYQGRGSDSPGRECDSPRLESCNPGLESCGLRMDSCNLGLVSSNLEMGFCSPGLESSNPGSKSSNLEMESCNLKMESCDPGLESCDPGLESCDPGLESCDPGLKSCGPGLKSCDPGLESCNPEMGSCNPESGSDCPGELKLANGGLHFPHGASCDWTDSDWSLDIDSEPVCPGSGGPLEACASQGLWPREETPSAAELLRSLGLSSELPQNLGSSAKSTSAEPSPISHSPVGWEEEAEVDDDEEVQELEEELKDLHVLVRPQTLRTVPGLPVSLSCDATPLSPEEDPGFYCGYEEGGRRQSAPEQLPHLDPPGHSDPKLMPKRFGIAEFFTRGLFSRKPKEPKATSHTTTGWRLFGKTANTSRAEEPSTEDPETNTNISTSTATPEQSPEAEQDVSPVGAQRPLAASRRKNLEFEPLSTTALILEDRPSNLPAKSVEETQRHKQEYEEMVAGAKRREMKDAQKKKRQMKERHRQEDIISNAMIVWNNEILPNWDALKGTRRVRELWWQGLPPSVRGRVWSLAIGNELNITPELYEIFLSRAKEKWRSYSETSSVNDSESDGGASLADRESSLDLIKLDISRTFPSLFIFQKGGPYHDLLHSVLGAYTCYRPDIGYVQGMSFIAAVLILNLEEAEAFITFANLLNKSCQMAFFRVDHDLMLKYFAAFEVFFEENLPRLFDHFQSNNLTPDLYLIDWIFTLYSKPLPLDVACRVWDVFCRDGEESLFRTGLGILRLFQEVLLQMDFIHMAQFLSRLPDDLQAAPLFSAMATTHMISRNRRWAQVFSALMKDGVKEEKNASPALRS